MDERHHREGPDIGQRVAGDRRDGTDGLDEDAGHAGPCEIRDVLARLEARIGPEQPLGRDEGWKMRLVRGVEERGRSAHAESGNVQLPQCELSGQRRKRDREQRGSAHAICREHHRASGQSIDGRTAQDPCHRVAAEAACRKDADLERARVEIQDGERRQGQRRKLRAERADALASPEEVEVPCDAELHSAGELRRLAAIFRAGPSVMRSTFAPQPETL